MRRVAVALALAGARVRRLAPSASASCASRSRRARRPTPSRASTTRASTHARSRSPPRRPPRSSPRQAAARRSCWRPRGFSCTALVGADGGVHVQLAPPGAVGARRPGRRSTSRSRAPASAASPRWPAVLFPTASKDNGIPCRTPHPARERVAKLLPTVRAFIDPAGVRGTGAPSGGRLRGRRRGRLRPGPLGLRRARDVHARARRAGSCQAIISDFLARVGTR